MLQMLLILLKTGLPLQVTFQAVLSTDGVASFVAFVYENESIPAIEALQGLEIVGFDAGDRARSATVFDAGSSGTGTLTTSQIFRIDGMF